MADFTLINESSLSLLKRRTETLITRLSKSKNIKVYMENMSRPDIDEYFLKIASVVSERATCQRHHMGAVAAKDKHILATGSTEHRPASLIV